MSDVLDILDVDRPQTPEGVSIESILGNDQKKKKKKIIEATTFKRPEGMHRELYALLSNSDLKDSPSLLPSDSAKGYKQIKAKLGLKKVRPWRFMPFSNPARKDGALLCHWRRIADEGKDYPFARFNKIAQVPSYSDSEYQHLHSENWSRQETDYLFEMSRKFDLRFLVIYDRWDKSRFPDRSIEDIKERYYAICSILLKIRSPPGQEPKLRAFDAEHERRRKEQLKKLYNRTPEQIEEEQTLLNELRKIEMRKKEREKKTQDLQKLITAADNNTEIRRAEKKGPKKKLAPQRSFKLDGSALETAGIKFPDFKSSGVSLRSQRMKLPAAVGQKKAKAIEHLLQELGIVNPVPTEDICLHFNELRSDMVLLYELKLALATCEFEMQTLRHQVQALKGSSTEPQPLVSTSGQTLGIPQQSFDLKPESPSKQPRISEVIDVNVTPGTPNVKSGQGFQFMGLGARGGQR